MALNKRGSHKLKNLGTLSAFASVKNSSQNTKESWKQRKLREYFQKRVLVSLGLGVCLFYLLGSKTSTNRVVENLGMNHTKDNIIPLSETSYSITETNNTKYETENDAFSPTKEGDGANITLSSPFSSISCGNPRLYPEIKYYQLNAEANKQPSFLTKDAQYIRGKLPFIFRPKYKKKLCIETNEWETTSEGRQKFSDGQNPSILSLSTKASTSSKNKNRFIEKSAIGTLSELVGGEEIIEDMFAGVVYVGGAQCGYNMSPNDKELYKLSPLDKPPAEQSLFLFLDNNFDTVIQTTILLERDQMSWGKKKFISTNNDRTVEKLDDPRLFIYQGELWVLFRSGREFGYDKQVHNKLHFELEKDEDGGEKLIVYIKASESLTSCCGRNMAMISETTYHGDKIQKDLLKTVTWVDPLTIDVVHDPSLLPELSSDNLTQRNLRQQQKKSDIHGTNGYMIPIPERNEYLGIAHFHRPENRDTSDYALHGHHYTHALFTISQSEPHILTRISNEFLFESLHPSKRTTDGEVIQFASGLDIIEKKSFTSKGEEVFDHQLMISYGVNDCEPVVATIDLEDAYKMLVDVDKGTQVIDLMKSAEII